jgi:hypothetical protein
MQFEQTGVTDLELTSSKYSPSKNVSVTYWQGPIIKDADLPVNVTRFAFFRSEIHSLHTNETRGEMVNTPAIHSIGYGKGRVVVSLLKTSRSIQFCSSVDLP